MPIFEYRCPDGHIVERIRAFASRDADVTCRCGRHAVRVEISMPHCLPDGMYSYAPNCGDEAAFARRLDAMREGERVIQKQLPAGEG